MDPVAARRARHVVDENARVLETERAFAAGDLAAVGRLFAESHASLRDLFEVSSPELDALVEIADSTDGVVAARMTGAGFGGSTVNLVRHDRVGRVSRGHRTGLPAADRASSRPFSRSTPSTGRGSSTTDLSCAAGPCRRSTSTLSCPGPCRTTVALVDAIRDASTIRIGCHRRSPHASPREG